MLKPASSKVDAKNKLSYDHAAFVGVSGDGIFARFFAARFRQL